MDALSVQKSKELNVCPYFVIHMFFGIYTVPECIFLFKKEKNVLDMSLQRPTVCQTTGRSWLQESPRGFKDYRTPAIRYLFDCSACKCLPSFQVIPDSERCHLLPTTLHLSQLTHTRFSSDPGMLYLGEGRSLFQTRNKYYRSICTIPFGQ